MRIYKYMSTIASKHVGCCLLYCTKHDLGSNSFLKEYLMVLPYPKGLSLDSCVVYCVNVFWYI
jgi:hypothetical protein